MSLAKHRSHPNTPLAVKKHFFVSLAVLAIVVSATAFVSRSIPHGPETALEGAAATRDHKAMERIYRQLIQQEPSNLKYHRGYLSAHFATPKVQHVGKSTRIERNDQGVLGEYQTRVKSEDPVTRDIGHYGLGFIHINLEDAPKALEHLGKVGNREMPFLNNTIGYVYLKLLKRADQARSYFFREIAVSGNISGAVSNLSDLFWETRNDQELHDLLRDEKLAPHVPPHYQRYLHLKENRIFGYLHGLLDVEAGSLSWMGLLSALFIALMFLIYVYFIDAFEKERITLLLGIFLSGMLSAALATLLYDWAGCFLRFRQDGTELNDLAFFIFGVGLIEELVKILPVLFVVWVLREWNESVDILAYAAVSAIGFACLENSGYFTRVSIGLIMGRTLSAVVMHIGLSCLAAYGIFLARYRPGKLGYLNIPLFFGAAVLIHGLYDYFITSSLGLAVVSTLILFFIMAAFRNMWSNALNRSEFAGGNPLTLNLTLYLFYGVLCVLSLQFCLLSVRYGLALSFKNLFVNVFQFYLLVIILIANFGTLHVRKGKWRSLIDRKKS